MSKTGFLAICLAVAVAFVLGWCTKPQPLDLHPQVIDSLNTSLKKALQLQEKYLADGRREYERGKAAQVVKVIHHTVYKRDTAHNHALPKHSKDSLIKVVLKVPQTDSSTFTVPVADGVLDLASKNVLLENDQDSDSVTIASLFRAYADQDSAKHLADKALANREAVIDQKDQTIEKQSKEIHRQKFLKWVFLGLGVVAALL